MDEVEVEFMTRKLDNVLEFIHADYVLKNVKKDNTFYDLILNITLEELYHDFLKEVSSRNIPEHLFLLYSLRLRTPDWYSISWKSEERISKINRLANQMFKYDFYRRGQID